MAKTTTKSPAQAGQQIAKAGSNPLAVVKGELASPGMMAALRDAVPVTARAYLTPERIMRIVTTALSRSPKLLECEPKTILRSVIDLVQLGLEPGGPLGHGYLVPFRNNKTGKTECQAIVGYQGYLAIARRSGEIESVTAEIICANDKYDVQFGDDPHLHHKRELVGDRGEPIAVYCVAKFKGGGKHIEVMTKAEVAAIRARSQARDSGPWVTDPDMMARKTVIKRARHYWPMSVEMAQAAELDDRVDAGTYVPDGPVVEAPSPLVEGTHKLGQEKQQEPAPVEVKGDREAEAFGFGPPPMTDEEVEAAEAVAAAMDRDGK